MKRMLDWNLRQWRAALAVPLLLMAMLACNQSTVAQEAQAIGNAGAQLALILGNTALSAKLKQDTVAWVAQINAWKSGTSCQNIEAATQLVAQDYAAVAALFGATVPPNVQALVDLALVTLPLVLSQLPGCAPPANLARAKLSATAPAKSAKDFKTRWNAIVVADPSLKGAELK